jgi:hypothetical protein
MTKNTKTIVWIGIYGVVAYGIYYMVKNMHVTPRQKSILAIEENTYKGLEDAFLKAWGNATKLGQSEFTYLGKVYMTKGGKAKK